MYKRVKLDELEGLGFTQDTLDFLQSSYRDAIGALANLLGDLVIVTGVADLGANWGDGWVSINGELMPFVGGLKAPNIIIEEIISAESFADGSNKNVYFTKRAKLANAGGNAFAAFTRLSTVKGIMVDVATALNNAATAIANAAAAQVAANNAQTTANNANTNANNRVAKGGDVMTGPLQLNSGVRFQAAGPEFFKKTTDIGDWNMDTTLSKLVDFTALGIDASKIVGVQIIIFSDPNIVTGEVQEFTLYTSTGGSVAGAWFIDRNAKTITMYRIAASLFDSASFSSTPYNRGKVTLEYTS